MTHLLIVPHTPSPSTDTLLRAVLEGARASEIKGGKVPPASLLDAADTAPAAIDAHLPGSAHPRRR